MEFWVTPALAIVQAPVLEQLLQTVALPHRANQTVLVPSAAHYQALLGKYVQSDLDSHAKLRFSRSCSSSSSSLSGSITAGVVIGSLLCCLVCIVLPIVSICCICCKKQSNRGMVAPQYPLQPMYGTPMYYSGQPWQPPPYYSPPPPQPPPPPYHSPPPPPPPPPPLSSPPPTDTSIPNQENPPKY